MSTPSGPAQIRRKLEGRLPGRRLQRHGHRKTTYKVRNKAFVFLGPADAMLKLNDSINEAQTFAAKLPANCKVGIGGWVTLKFANGETVPLDVLTRWIKESHQLFASAEKTKTPMKKRKPKKPISGTR